MALNAISPVYGPVSSRRLGRSLGVDLVPFKTCTYDCIYCQLGHTNDQTTRRAGYVDQDWVLAELKMKLGHAPLPNYISLAGSGEPTLHAGIGELIVGIKRLTRVPVAVLTNGSLLWDPDVRKALMEADLVMPSLDAGDETTFQQVNRPHRGHRVRCHGRWLGRVQRTIPQAGLAGGYARGRHQRYGTRGEKDRSPRPSHPALACATEHGEPPPGRGGCPRGPGGATAPVGAVFRRIGGNHQRCRLSRPGRVLGRHGIRHEHPRSAVAPALHGRRGCRRAGVAHPGSRQAAGRAREERRRGGATPG